ncbi:MAG: hypothetical protein COT17_06285 [Elusimicrobia bacterium CG08_land_8_20_14_0_20_51_18]|nr:MAG: hypothetical protein COT17_06285 [Elusimicrobia bacterium CG08_land_8_20_14_0_20_51_18]
MDLILYPPFAFILSLITVYLFSALFSGFAPKPAPNPEKTKTYACGEDFETEKVIPNYEEFYPFAIFFTILHVAGLMLATWAIAGSASFVLPLGYVAAVALILTILFIR